jgi:hypothetical protein
MEGNMIEIYTVCFHENGDCEAKEMNLHGAISIGHEILTEGIGGPEWKVFSIIHDIDKTYLHVS